MVRIACISLLLISISGCTLPNSEVDLSSVDPAIAAHIQKYEQIANAAKEDSQKQGELAIVYELHGFFNAAINSYERASSLDPANPRWSYFTALLLAAQTDRRSGLQLLDSVLEHDDLYSPVWLWKGTWHLELAEIAHAKSAFERAANLGSRTPATVGLAKVHLQAGELDDAISLLLPLATEDPQPYVLRLLGLAYARSGQTDRTKELLNRTMGVEPIRWPDPWVAEKGAFLIDTVARQLEIAELLLKTRKFDQAFTLLEELAAQYPANPNVLYSLSLSQQGLDRPKDAIATLRGALELYPDRYLFHNDIARLLHGQDQTPAALQHLDKAIAIDPELNWALEQKGRILIEQRKWEEARAVYALALQAGHNDPELLVYTGMVEGMLNSWSTAAQLFQDALTLDPSFVPAYINLARALGIMGMFDDAETILHEAETAGASVAQLEVVRSQIARLKSRGS